MEQKKKYSQHVYTVRFGQDICTYAKVVFATMYIVYIFHQLLVVHSDIIKGDINLKTMPFTMLMTIMNFQQAHLYRLKASCMLE